MNGLNHYQVLGVEPDASLKEIKSAFRGLALQWHPDVNNSPEARVKFEEAGQAYDILKDSERRRDYDLGVRGGNKPSSDAYAHDHSDITSSDMRSFWEEWLERLEHAYEKRFQTLDDCLHGVEIKTFEGPVVGGHYVGLSHRAVRLAGNQPEQATVDKLQRMWHLTLDHLATGLTEKIDEYQRGSDGGIWDVISRFRKAEKFAQERPDQVTADKVQKMRYAIMDIYAGHKKEQGLWTTWESASSWYQLAKKFAQERPDQVITDKLRKMKNNLYVRHVRSGLFNFLGLMTLAITLNRCCDIQMVPDISYRYRCDRNGECIRLKDTARWTWRQLRH